MNAPEPQALPRLVALARIHPSPTNPRKRHDPAKHAELVDSVKALGVLQPLLCRPLPIDRGPGSLTIAEKFDHFELVAGERRWRAAKDAGLAELLVMVRDLDDKQVLEIQLVENLQREDVHPLEEAEGYERLMQHHGYSADDLAAKVGKSRSYIYGRTRLLALCPQAREAFYAGQLDASKALLIARIPTAAVQAQAVARAIEPDYHGELPSYRHVRDILECDFMLRLDQAPFSRSEADLVPGAGSCKDCPKRTGNQKELFADVKGADICTDPPCFAAKKAAHAAAQRAAAEAEGRKVIDGAAAKKIKPHDYSYQLSGGYVRLDERCYEDPKHRTVRELLGTSAPPADLLVDPKDKTKVIEIAHKTAIAEALQAKGIALPRAVSGSSKTDAEKKAEAKRKIEIEFRRRLFDNLRGRFGLRYEATGEDDPTPADPYELDEWRLVASHAYTGLGFENRKRIARLWVGADGKADDHALVSTLDGRIPALDRMSCQRLLLETALVGELAVYSFGTPDKPERLLAAAAREGIDAAAIKAAVIKESRDKAKGKAKPAKAPKASRSDAAPTDSAPDPAPSPLPAAQANDIGATPAAPADEPAKPRRKAAQAKADPAPAAPGNAPATPAKPARRDLADGMIYCHPNDRTLTWTGKGKEPAWVKELFSRGLGLDVRDIHEATTIVMGDWPFPVEGSRA